MPQVVVQHDERKKSAIKMTALVAGVVAGVIVVLIIVLNLVWVLQHAQAINNAKSLDSKQRYAAEIQSLQHYLSSNPPRQYQPDALIMLGQAAEKTGDYHVAFRAFLQADIISSKPSLDLKLDVAKAAAAIGDKSTAISYYKQVISLTPPSATEKIGELQDEVRGLGGTP